MSRVTVEFWDKYFERLTEKFRDYTTSARPERELKKRNRNELKKAMKAVDDQICHKLNNHLKGNFVEFCVVWYYRIAKGSWIQLDIKVKANYPNQIYVSKHFLDRPTVTEGWINTVEYDISVFLGTNAINVLHKHAGDAKTLLNIVESRATSIPKEFFTPQRLSFVEGIERDARETVKGFEEVVNWHIEKFLTDMNLKPYSDALLGGWETRFDE